MTNIPLEQQEEFLNKKWLKPVKHYTRGQFFGERSLENQDEVRAGTAICTQDTVVMSLIREDYQKFVVKIRKKNEANVTDFLRCLPMFATWPTKALSKLQY